MAATNETSGHNDSETSANQPPDGDVPAGIRERDHSGDRSAAGLKPSALDWRNRTPDRAFDMSRVGEDAISDRRLITTLMTKNRTYGPERDIHMLVLATLDEIIQNPKKLRTMTMLTPEQFDYLCVRFAERVAERGLCRLFWDDDLRASDPGTRSRLYIRHALLMSLLHKKEANTEAVLGVFFGMDQGTVSRYLKVVNGVLAEILPTARNLTEIIRGIYERRSGAEGGAEGGAEDRDGTAKPETEPPFRAGSPTPVPAAAAGPSPGRPGPLSVYGPPAPTVIGAPASGNGIPGILAGPVLEAASGLLSTRVATITDGTHTQVERSKDHDWNRATYSGKKKAHTYNTNITTTPDRIVIHISDTVPGSTNDLTLLRESPPDFGSLSDAAADPDTPEAERPIHIYDRGYQGIQKDTPGAEIWMGLKRNAGSDPETGGLTQKERDHNTEVTRARISVEHVIGDIKRYALMRKRYHGTPEQFNDELNVVTGLVNLKRMWNRIKSKEDPSLMAMLGAWRAR